MKKAKHWALPAALLVITLSVSACGSPTPNTDSTPTSTPSQAAAATENQVASVIAEYEADWREVVDGALRCRSDWALAPGKMSNLSCYLSEQTITVTAQLALRDLAALEIPGSMAPLVDDTTAVLEQISTVNLKGVCGDGMVEPSSTPECNEALGTLKFLYTQLGNQLDAWGPYL